jgi:NitT/TauT family transport system substrate-binding protein
MINTGIWGLSALVGKETNIRTFQDLKGKKIALPFPGAPLDFQTKYILEAYGIKESQVEFIYAPFTQAIPLLLNSQIDAAPLPEPLATEVVRNKGLKRLIDYRRAWAVVTKGDGSSPQVSLFATAALVHAERDLINRFVKAWEMATKEVQRQPQQLAEKYAQVLATSSGVLNEAIKNTLYLIPTTGENKRRIREYYLLMNRYYKTLSKDLGEDFFF